MNKPNAIEFKLAGGAAAQALGLMNAIFIKLKTGRDFQIRYFPHSTGTYWPFAINFLLEDGELLDDESTIRGFHPDRELAIGKIIRQHPLERKVFSYERFLKMIRGMGLEFRLRKLLGEIALEATPSRLSLIDDRISRVSGGFVPIFDANVMKEMNVRFVNGRGRRSPFVRDKEFIEEYVAIHYRIGDKRTKFTIDSDFGGDGIFDPECFKEILGKLGLDSSTKIYVVSDEPYVAQQLLQTVGIVAELFTDVHDIWVDLYHLSQAKYLIGSWSQVSQLAAVCVANNGGEAHLPSSTQVGTQANFTIPNTLFFGPRYLESNHRIYSADFNQDENAHKGYGSRP